VFSHFFTSKLFLRNISSKFLKRVSRDAGFYGEFCGIVEISVEPLLKNFHHSFIFFDRRSWTI